MTSSSPGPGSLVGAVLFDRDGTLIADAPAPRDPHAIAPMPTARQALDRLRAAGIPIGVVTNQPAIGRGTDTEDGVGAVHREVERRLGAVDVWCVCPHEESAGCACRKPRPGLVIEGASRLGVAPEDIVVVGDIGGDMAAAAAAGARGILVPTPVTRIEEVEEAPAVAADLLAAVRLVLEPARAGSVPPTAGAAR